MGGHWVREDGSFLMMVGGVGGREEVGVPGGRVEEARHVRFM